VNSNLEKGVGYIIVRFFLVLKVFVESIQYVHVKAIGLLCIHTNFTSLLFKSYLQVLHRNGMAEFSVTSNETIIVSPEFVGSRLLLKLKEMAEEYLGMPVANAVISVPAEFDLQQRNSTIQAANLAGNSTFD
jgi:molecular chaperone DnaK (HSP70)